MRRPLHGSRRRKLKLKRKTRRGRLYRNKQNGGSTSQPTFHIFIPSAGRTSVKRLLDSMKGQLKRGDAVTLVFDGKVAYEKSGFQPSWFDGFAATTTWKVHDPPIGKWSHGLANEYQEKLAPETTFVMHADDDDRYIPGAFNTLRSKCTNPECLYIARMRNKEGLVIPRDNGPFVYGNIGTPNGIIPFAKRDEAKWGLRHGGDLDYFLGLSSKVKCLEHIPDVIYEVLHDQGEASVS